MWLDSWNLAMNIFINQGTRCYLFWLMRDYFMQYIEFNVLFNTWWHWTSSWRHAWEITPSTITHAHTNAHTHTHTHTHNRVWKLPRIPSIYLDVTSWLELNWVNPWRFDVTFKNQWIVWKSGTPQNVKAISSDYIEKPFFFCQTAHRNLDISWTKCCNYYHLSRVLNMKHLCYKAKLGNEISRAIFDWLRLLHVDWNTRYPSQLYNRYSRIKQVMSFSFISLTKWYHSATLKFLACFNRL